jgi:hypothetical protein
LLRAVSQGGSGLTRRTTCRGEGAHGGGAGNESARVEIRMRCGHCRIDELLHATPQMIMIARGCL